MYSNNGIVSGVFKETTDIMQLLAYFAAAFVIMSIGVKGTTNEYVPENNTSISPAEIYGYYGVI